MPPSENEHELIEQAKAGDKVALEELLVAHSHELSTHIAQRLPAWMQSVVSVEDMMQEAFTQSFLKIDRLRETSPRAFVAWLKAIGEMSLMGFIKAQGRQKRGGGFRRLWHATNTVTGSVGDLMQNLPGDGTTASQGMARREAIAALQVGLAGLPSAQRQAIQLHFIQGKTLEETATEMNRTPAAIRGLVHRGKQALSEAMGRASLWLSRK